MAYFPYLKNNYQDYVNPFHLASTKKRSMIYALKDDFLRNGDVIPLGTPIQTDEETKAAFICKYAYVTAVASDKKTLTVKGGHFFQAKDTCAISGEDTLKELTIDTVDNDMDKIVLSAANETIKAGSILVEVETKEGIVAAKHLPNRIVDLTTKIDYMDKTVSATNDATVLLNVVHYPEEYLNRTLFPGSILLVGSPSIMFTISNP